jgi:Flp pilus assembly pilin Flp
VGTNSASTDGTIEGGFPEPLALFCSAAVEIFGPFGRASFMDHLRRLWSEQEGQDIAEYAVMLAVILVIVVGTVRLIGSNANNVFSSVASSIQ